VFSRNRNVNRITTFTTGVALGLSILSGPASAASATPASPSADGYVEQAPVPDAAMSVDAAPLVDAVPAAEEATPPVVDDTPVPTTPPVVEFDEPVAPPPAAADAEAVVPETAFTEVRPAYVAVRGIPAPPVVALAPGNWGISARVVGVRKAPRLLSVDSKPAPQVLGVRLTREDTLPVTGVDTGLLTMIAAALLVVGTVLVRQGRAPAPAGTVRSS
jgi:hypothetical protein